MNPESSHQENVVASGRSTSNEWPIFISYRRSDATRKIAMELKKELEASTIKAASGQVFALDVFVDVAEGHQSDFQANLVPHLQHSRALIVLADQGAATRKADVAVDYLYEELDWWAAERTKTPPIILQLDQKAGALLVADSNFAHWRKVSFMDCFWEKWKNEEDTGRAEREQLLSWLRSSIRDYGQVIHLEEVRRLKRRALIASLFALVALVAGGFAVVLAYYYASAKGTAEKNEYKAKRSAAMSHYRVANDLRKKDPRASLAYLSAANELVPDDISIRSALDLAIRNGHWPQGYFQQLESSAIAIAEDKKAQVVAVSTKADGVYVWNVQDQKAVAHIKPADATVRRIVFLPDGRLFLSVAKENWADERPWFVENRARVLSTREEGGLSEITIPSAGFAIVDLSKKETLPLSFPAGDRVQHNDTCLDLQASSDGRTLVALTPEFAVVWDAVGETFSGKMLMRSGAVSPDGGVTDGDTFSCISLAPSGSQVTVGTLKGEILRATRSKAEWYTHPAIKTSAAVNALHYSPNERVFVAACGRPPVDRPGAFGTDLGGQLAAMLARSSGSGGAVEVHDAASGVLLGGAKTPASCVVGCMHPGGSDYFAGLDNGSVVSISLGTGDLESIREVHSGPISCLVVDDSGLLLAAGCGDGGLATINVPTFSLHQQKAQHERGILGLCFSSIRPMLFSAGIDGRVGFWDLSQASKDLSELNIGADSTTLVLSPDGSRTVVLRTPKEGENIIECYDTWKGALIWKRPTRSQVASLAYDGAGVNVKYADGSISRIVSGSSELPLKPGSVSFPGDRYRNHVGMLSQERNLELPTALGPETVVKPASENAWDGASGLCKSLVLYDRVNAKAIRAFDTGQPLHEWALDRDGKLLFTSCFGEAGVRIWQLDSGEQAIPLLDHKKTNFKLDDETKGEVYRFVISLDGSLLASHLNNQNDIYIWDLKSGYCIDVIELDHQTGTVSRRFDPEEGDVVVKRDNAHVEDIVFSDNGNCVGVLLNDHSAAVLRIRATAVEDLSRAALTRSFLKLTDSLVLKSQYPSVKALGFGKHWESVPRDNSSKQVGEKWSPRRIASEVAGSTDLDLLLRCAEVVGHAKMFPALRRAVESAKEGDSSLSVDLRRAWVLSLFGRGRCNEAQTLLSSWPPQSGLSDDLRFLYALLLQRSGKQEASEILASIGDPNARDFARKVVDFANGSGSEEPELKSDGKDGFWEAAIPSSIKAVFMQLASAEVMWGWIRRGDNEKAIENFKRIRTEDLGCRATMLLGFILAERGEKGTRIAQMLFSQYCSDPNEEFLKNGPLFRKEENERATKFFADQGHTLMGAKQPNSQE